jgi:hypothetical protein
MHVEQEVEATATERPIFGLPVDTGVLFANHKGVYQRSIEKNKTKLLRKLGFLAHFLDADEKIVFVTAGCSPYSTFELVTMGAVWVTLLKRSLFVFTNKRLFHIPTTWQLDYRGSIAQILYQDCKRLQVSGSGLVAEYHTGKKDRFANIPRRDRQIIKHFQFATGESDQRSEVPQRNHLCPSCTQVLPTRAAACPSCGLEFKTRAKARTRSILLPGGGYFYTGHPFLGACDALGEAYLVILNVVVLCAGLLGDAEAMATLPVFLALLVGEKVGTIHHSNSFLKEFIPADLKALLSGRQVQKVQMELPPIPAPSEPKRRPEDVLSLRWCVVLPLHRPVVMRDVVDRRKEGRFEARAQPIQTAAGPAGPTEHPGWRERRPRAGPWSCRPRPR